MTKARNREIASDVERWVCDTLNLQYVNNGVDAYDDKGNAYEIKSCSPYTRVHVNDKTGKERKIFTVGRFAIMDKDLDKDDLNFIFVLRTKYRYRIIARATTKQLKRKIKSLHDSHKISWFNIDNWFGIEEDYSGEIDGRIY